ncbi:MAG: flagellar hook-basal body complex protein, partial [Lachnospiraceae bacterium]|nr:flagellar hook-basal body complex protein [Lachnospiraceae bacterium]
MQIGLGAGVSSITTTVDSVGGSQRTDNPFDIMIEGDGFFVVNNGDGNLFTRAGSFMVDAAGTLCNANGYAVMGWQVDPNNPTATVQDNVSPLRIMSPTNQYSEPEATTAIHFSGNIDSADTAFDSETGKFKFEPVKKHIMMGNSVSIQLGYLNTLELVFVGFISGVAFGFEPGSLPYIEITAMDIKGVMMGGSYATALTATTYSAAVREVLQRTGEGKLQQMGGITAPPEITNTPDAGGGTPGGVGGAPSAGAQKSSPITVEMVGESDYEFVVRAAKRYNYEFFVDRGKVFFRPAKNNTTVLMKMGSRSGLRGFNIQYSITGVVGQIEARAMDPGKGEVISAKSKFNNTISTANKATELMGKGAKVYLDASISSAEEAEARVASLMEKMSYRLGSLEADCVGIPDLVPGRFIEVAGLGVPVDNEFYLTTVTHEFNGEHGYSTRIEGCAAQIKKTEGAAAAAAGAAGDAAAAAGGAAAAAGGAAAAAGGAAAAAGGAAAAAGGAAAAAGG